MDLLNGAFSSLSGPVGFTPSQPRIKVRRIKVTNNESTPHDFILFKGASGGSDVGTEIYNGTLGGGTTVDIPMDLVLDSADFLTGKASASFKLVVIISADIDF
jgi:hypothetical protein